MRYLVPRQVFPMIANHHRVAAGPAVVASALVGFRLDQTDAFLDDQALWEVIQARAGTDGVFDLWQPKQGGELLVWGSAQSAEPVTRMGISVRCGPLHKRLAVCGDRHWEPGPLGWKASDPLPFTDMPVVWSRSFGGASVPAFPHGVGADAMALIRAGQEARLPNITLFDEAVLHPEDASTPAGLSPPPRVAQVPATSGTFDRQWLARHFPMMPLDFAADFFNLASTDQRVAAPWQGAEAVVIEGMNAAHPRLAFQVPSLRMRCFFAREEGGELAETAMRMDTLALFPSDGVGMLVFRAEIGHAGHNGKGIAELMMGLEDAARPKPFEHYHQVRAWRTHADTRLAHLHEDHELMPETVLDAGSARPAPMAAAVDPQSAAAARAADRVRSAGAGLGSASMASVLAAAPPPIPAAVPEPVPDAQGAERPAQAEPSMRLMDDLAQLAQRLSAEPQTPLASIMEEWLASQDIQDGVPSSAERLKDGLASLHADEPEVRQRMTQVLLGSTAAMKDALARGDGGTQVPMPSALQAMLEGAGNTVKVQGHEVALPDLDTATQMLGRPELADQLRELVGMAESGDGSGAIDDAQTRERLKFLLSGIQDARRTNAENVDGLAALLPEGALTKDNLKGLLAGWAEGTADDSNPLQQAVRQSGFQMPEPLRDLLQSARGESAAARSDALDGLFEQVAPDLLEEMGRGAQLGLNELMRMLQADEAADPVDSETAQAEAVAADAGSPDASAGDAALEATLQATQQSAPADGTAPQGPAAAAAGAQEVRTQQVPADLAQARRDSRGRSFLPVGLPAAAAAALGAAVLREQAAGASFKNRDLAGADLRGADLTQADLAGAFLEGADLTGANLSGARCTGAVLIGARLDAANCSGADFSGANLGKVQAASSNWSSANLCGAVLAQANLTGAHMEKTRLDGCDAVEASLVRADLSHSHCEKGDFSQADLSGAHLVSADWTRTRLVGASLEGSVATKAHLKACVLMDVKGHGANLAQACLDGARLIGADLSGLHAPGLRAAGSSWYTSQLGGAFLDGSDLAAAHFVRADLSRGSLNRCNLREALFTDSDLQGADLSGAQLCGATLQGANATAAGLRQANLFGADLAGATLDRCDLSGATLDRTLLALPADD